MAHVSHKLSNALEGALAGGGDPATSPLYVFGPFLKLIVVAGVAGVTFGASLWLVIITIAMVSAMYRLVMAWVVDGTGGSGLSEEEFGSWAVKVNAGITFVEYTLTFLVSMAALVTFIADRLPVLNEPFLGIQVRTFVAIGLSILTGWLVNRGPKTAARAFGPATAGVLLLLWTMIAATIWRNGLQLPSLDLRAFSPEYLGLTFGGYARILAVMTGIEIFANLVAAYEGKPAEKSRKAFNSLLIIMGTTSLTMLIVGPAIFELSDPLNTEVSVFTQTMDQLLPAPLPWLGTLVGIAVLLSASAASAQGLQNLAVGLKHRHYIPSAIGQPNRFEVADAPVWIEVAIVCVCFLAFGTSEETYLAIYAAGVFILLSMTGWAATKRLLRQLRRSFSAGTAVALTGTAMAALLTSGATFIIFEERFLEGAWTYLLFLPLLYVTFTVFRQRLGPPTPVEERLGQLMTERGYIPLYGSDEWFERASLRQILVPLDGSSFAEQALPTARALCQAYGARLTLLSVADRQDGRLLQPRRRDSYLSEVAEQESYLSHMAGRFNYDNIRVDFITDAGPVAETINRVAQEHGADLIVMSTHGRSGIDRLMVGSVASQVIQLSETPMLLLRPSDNAWRSRGSQFKRLLVTLDGSELAEHVLPYAQALATRFESEVLLLSVPEQSMPEIELARYLKGIADDLRGEGLEVETAVTGRLPARTIVSVSESEGVDLIMLATRGQGGVDRLMVGSVADRIVRQTNCPIFLTPVR